MADNTIDGTPPLWALPWLLSCPADMQQKGFYGRSLRKLEAQLDKGSSSPLALDPDLASRMSGEQVQLLHLNRALLYYLSGASFVEGAGWVWGGGWLWIQPGAAAAPHHGAAVLPLTCALRLCGAAACVK